ncbi:MAG: winged helix-turn-helix transcriptional regulator [Euryarchaeota archaeon]|nr:winged helix-turn-helix transcriptional regulator [Euryarchaeota archaeon]
MLELLTPRRLEILKYLSKERHPEEIAAKFKISRQAADKHLSILYRAGMVSKKVKYGKRPMVYYQITDAGAKFISNVEDLIENHILGLQKEMKYQLRELDEMLVSGEISEREYRALRRKMEVRYRWLSQ